MISLPLAQPSMEYLMACRGRSESSSDLTKIRNPGVPSSACRQPVQNILIPDTPFPGFLTVRTTPRPGICNTLATYAYKDLSLFGAPDFLAVALIECLRDGIPVLQHPADEGGWGVLGEKISAAWTVLLFETKEKNYLRETGTLLSSPETYRVFSREEELPRLTRGWDFWIRVYPLIRGNWRNKVVRLEWRMPEEMAWDLPAAVFWYGLEECCGENPGTRMDQIRKLRLGNLQARLLELWGDVEKLLLRASL